MTETQQKFSLDWRVAFGLGITLTWISAGLIYLVSMVGLRQFVQLPTADIGSFLEGAFAPLAFLWLVIGHFMQQSEIAANTRAIQIQERSARRLEVHSQRDSYFKLNEMVQEQLGAVAGFHYVSVCGPTGTGEISSDEFAEMRNQASGDTSLFIRKMISLAIANRDDPEKLQEIFFGTDIRKRHTNNFSNSFGKLLKIAREVDTDELVEGALMTGSASGLLYRIIRHVSGEEPLDALFANVRGEAPATLAQTPARAGEG